MRTNLDKRQKTLHIPKYGLASVEELGANVVAHPNRQNSGVEARKRVLAMCKRGNTRVLELATRSRLLRRKIYGIVPRVCSLWRNLGDMVRRSHSLVELLAVLAVREERPFSWYEARLFEVAL